MSTTIVHSFRMGDVDDPEIYAAQPLYEWEKSEKGQWVMQHSLDQPTFYIRPDLQSYGHSVTVEAELTEEDATYFALKWA